MPYSCLFLQVQVPHSCIISPDTQVSQVSLFVQEQVQHIPALLQTHVRDTLAITHGNSPSQRLPEYAVKDHFECLTKQQNIHGSVLYSCLKKRILFMDCCFCSDKSWVVLVVLIHNSRKILNKIIEKSPNFWTEFSFQMSYICTLHSYILYWSSLSLFHIKHVQY